MLRTVFFLLLTTFLCTCGSAPEVRNGVAEKPNIILIMTDDQGYGDLAAHGNPWLKTPNLDALHEASVRFTNFHVGTTCAPTRAGLMTGVNCNRTGAWHTVGGRSLLAERFVTVADEMKEEGYATGIFGKWHLGDNYPYRPQDRGFEEVLIHGGGGVGQTPDYWENDYFDDTYFRNGSPEKFEGYCTDVWFRESMKYMEQKAAGNQPFFTYISTNAPHSPYHVEERYVAPYRGNDEIANPEFYGMIANADENIGRLLNWLEEKDLADNTIVVFLTDNGTSGGAYLDKQLHVKKGYNAGMRGTKGQPYEGGHRVPLFIRFPDSYGVAPAEYADLVNYNDVLPTLVELAGGKVTVDYKMDGVSLLPLVTTGQQPNLDERILITDTQRGELAIKGKQRCVMQGNWRLVKKNELYNLATDPGQKENVFEDHPRIAAQLDSAYDAWWTEILPDIEKMNRIVVGAAEAEEVLLTCHDWHTEGRIPWHQGFIREALVDNGWWALDVLEAGQYQVGLYRYPPEARLAINEVAAAVPAVPNGKVQPEGVPLAPAKLSISFGDKRIERPVDLGKDFQTLTIHLPAGDVDLTTVMSGLPQEIGSAAERGFYYVSLSPVRK